MKKFYLISLLIIFAFMANSQVNDNLQTAQGQLSVTVDNDFKRLEISYPYSTKTFSTKQGIYGKPEIPIIQKKYLLPLDAEQVSVQITNTTQQTISGLYNIYPEQPPIPLNGGESPKWVEPDPNIYESNNPYPGKFIDIVHLEYTFGYQIVTVNLYPVSYLPLSQTLKLNTDISFQLNYTTPNGSDNRPQKVTSYMNDLTRNYIINNVCNTGDIDSFLGGSKQIVQSNSIDNIVLNPIPGSEGSIPEFIIITSEEYSNPVPDKYDFTDFVEWKTKSGIPTVIITLEQINQKYNGADQAERIFYYLKDVYSKWGSMFILLGGDTEIIPARYAYWDSYEGSWRPSDLYYSDVYKDTDPDYNWNNNGNSQFGETGDLIDGGPEHFVGRLPFTDIDELDASLSKTVMYEKAQMPDPTYFNNLLFMTGYLGDYYQSYMGDELNTIIDYLTPINPNLNFWRLYDDPSLGNITGCDWDELFNRQNTLSNLENGGSLFSNPFHLVYHMDHSGPTNMSTSSKVAKESINSADVTSLSNSPYYQIFYTGGCSPNSFDYHDAISEYYYWNPNGAGAAFIGSTATSYSSDYLNFNNFCIDLYAYNNRSNISDLLYTACTSPSYRKRIALLGDPSMDIWTNTPQSLIVNTTPSTFYTGQQTIQVKVDNLANGSIAKICLFKENEVYAVEEVTGTGGMVSVNIDCTPNTPGGLYLTVTGHNYMPFETILDISINSGTHLYVIETAIDDDLTGSSNGNNNNIVDVGETIELTLDLENQGQISGTNITATLSLDPDHASYDYITITQNQSSFGNIPSLGQGTSNPPFVFTVSTDAPDNLMGKFVLDIEDGSSNSYQDEFYIEFHAAFIDLVSTTFITQINNDEIIDAGDQVSVTFELFNGGSGIATEIEGELTTFMTNVIDITSSNQTFGNIPSYLAIQNSNPFEFDVDGLYTGQTIETNLTITDDFGKEWEYPVNFDKPNVITGLGYSSNTTDISLYWDPDPTAKGYNVYRSDTESGVYMKINSQIITGFSGYTDAGLPELTTFYYEVCAVSSSGIKGEKTDPLKAWTTLPYHLDWRPLSTNQSVYGSYWGSPNTYDLDNNNEKEIFITSGTGDSQGNKGVIFGFEHNGEELFNIDNNVTTRSGFANIGISMTSTPAIGDIDNDGIVEVVVATRMGLPDDATKHKLFVYKNTDINNDNKPDLMWEKQIAYKNFNGVVLSDLDDDGTLEIIAPNQWGNTIEVFDYLGNNFPGWPKTTGENPIDKKAVSMPVVVDLDNDGDKEIVIGLEGGIYIWNSDGTNYLSQNPINLNIPSGERLDCPVIAADIDNDGFFEILFMSIRNTTGYIYTIEANGDLVTGWANDNHSIALSIASQTWAWPPAFVCGDIDMDGDIEVVVADAGMLKVWNNQGNPVLNKEIPTLQCQYLQPLIADVDGTDNECEIIIPTNEGLIYAYKLSGESVIGWPLTTGSTTSIPLIDDIDNDAKNEIIAASGSDVYIWETEGKSNLTQWGRFRLNSYNNAILSNSCSFNETPVEITTVNTIWNTDKHIQSYLIIKANADLTIHSTVTFVKESKIIVEVGGKLTVDGGKLTNACGELWQGIEVWGTSSGAQNPVEQGWVLINNGTIENAVIGVVANRYESSGSPTPGYTGGIIQAYRSQFRNCSLAVQFDPYEPFSVSGFGQCEFITDGDYLLSGYINPYAFAAIVNHRGVQFSRCNFENENPELFSLTNRGKGILCSNGNFTVHYGSSFSGLYYGIYAIGILGQNTFYVSNTEFNSYRGIYMSAYLNNRLDDNTFIVPVSAPGVNNDAYGLYMQRCTGYEVEDNTFTSSQSTPTGIGLYINNSGTDANEIYRNDFSNLEYSIVAQDINRYGNIRGLVIKCNTFSNTISDITVTGPTFYSANYGIAKNQGASSSYPTQMAGNLFYYNTTAIDFDDLNNGLGHFNYYCPLNTSVLNVNPLDYTHNSITNTLVMVSPSWTIANGCPPHTGGGGDLEKDALRSLMATSSEQADSTATVLAVLVDGGDTPELTNEVEQSTPQQTVDMYNELLAKSPYLSDSVVESAILKEEVFPNAMLRDIMVANAHSSKSDVLINSLDARWDPMPDYMKAQVLQGRSLVSLKEETESRLGAFQMDKARAFYGLSRIYMSDTLDATSSSDSLVNLLSTINTPGAQYQLALLRLDRGEYTLGSTVLSSIPANITLTTDEMVEHQHMVDYYNWLAALKQGNGNIMFPDSTQRQQLWVMATADSNLAGVYARNLLVSLGETTYCEPIVLPDTYKSTQIMGAYESLLQTEAPSLLKVFPNPTKDYVILEYTLETEVPATITIKDMRGVTIESRNFSRQQDQVTLIIKGWAPGVYVASLNANGKLIESVKFTVVK
jgi:hypothetical protein